MIRIENIGKVFNPRSRNRNEVLKGVSFELPEKGFIAIYGKSGSGKTTLLNIIGGLDRQDKGKIYIDGENVAGKEDKIRNAKIGFIFQNYYLERGYTIAEIMRNAMHIAGFKDEGEIARRTEEVLTLVDMERFKNKQGDALSGGQKQRVAIARALIKDPKIMILDDSTSAVDTATDAAIRRAFKEEFAHTTVFIIAQRISSVEDADRIIVMSEGRIDDIGTHEELLARNKIYRDVYLSQKGAGAAADEAAKEEA